MLVAFFWSIILIIEGSGSWKEQSVDEPEVGEEAPVDVGAGECMRVRLSELGTGECIRVTGGDSNCSKGRCGEPETGCEEGAIFNIRFENLVARLST